MSGPWITDTEGFVRLGDYTQSVLAFMPRASSSQDDLTFKHQSQLPRLPVPALEKTMERLLSSLHPLCSSAEYERLVRLVDDGFLAPGSVGRKLHRLLEERAETPKAQSTSWLHEWWLYWAYLEYRESLVLNVTYLFSFNQPAIPGVGQMARAAHICRAAAEFRDLLVTRQLPVDAMPKPLCMEMYKFMFNTYRAPIHQRDEMRIYKYLDYSHIVVMVRGFFFRLDLFTGSRDRLLMTANEIEQQLQAIWNASRALPTAACCPGSGPAPNGFSFQSVGLLTTEHRDVWASEYAHFMGLSKRNRQNWKLVESAMFVLCLDDVSPADYTDYNHKLWHSDGRNRCFDKSVQWVVFPDGQAGYIGEHSGMDGTVALSLVDHVCERSQMLAQETKPSAAAVASIDLPAPLTFDVDERLVQSMGRAQENLCRLVRRFELEILRFRSFGKNFIKQAKVSPDAFCQLAIHIAYYKIWGRMSPCYESAMTRAFSCGRTETGRTCTEEAAAYVKTHVAALSQTSPPSSSDARTRFDLFRVACARHSEIMKDASNAQGVDRHMLGMKLIAAEHGISLPVLYSDPIYQKSGCWTLSTSQVTSPYFEAGFGAVVPEGYGVCYSVRNDELHFKISTQNLRSDLFLEILEETLHELERLVSSVISTL